MSIRATVIAEHQGQQVSQFTLVNGDLEVSILNYGGIITRLLAPGRNGLADVVLGFDSFRDYQENSAYIGALIGRCANRIAGAAYSYENSSYQLDPNEPPNHLHGGSHGFHRQLWQADAHRHGGDLCLRLQRRSVHGEMGYPGNLDVVATYRLDQNNCLWLEVQATSDRPTPVSICQHSYFNLAGHALGTIDGHLLQLFASRYSETDAQLLPTGRLLPVAGTPYDFTEPTIIGINRSLLAAGYDINYALDSSSQHIRPAAILHDPLSGRTLSVATTKPGLQFYDGSHLANLSQRGKGNSRYCHRAGLCLETQHFPDAVNQPGFPSPLLRPAETYRHITSFAFSVA